MTDRRILAANDRVAHVSLRGQVAAPRFVAGALQRCVVPVADLCTRPDGARDKQVLRGQGFRTLEVRDGWAFGQDMSDGYVGYLPATALGQAALPSHRVAVRLAHLYSAPDVKARETGWLSFLSGVAIRGEAGDFWQVEGGWMAKPHLAPVDRAAEDAVTVAEMFLGTPYLWGGNSALGIDCSGLVQLAFWATGRDCARDSDLQERQGRHLAGDEPVRRGDLLFWRGHVAMAVGDGSLIHANAHHMSVVREPVEAAVARISAQGGGPVTARRRIF